MKHPGKQPGSDPVEAPVEAPLLVDPSRSKSPTGASKRSKSPKLVEYGLVAVIAGVVGVMAVPDMVPKVSNMESLATLTRLQYQVDAYRSALEEYRADHHTWPGYGPGRSGGWTHGAPSGQSFKRQMTQWTDEWGHAGPPIVGSRELGPYLELGLPKNVVNGLETVRILVDDEPFPSVPSGTTGWYFKPATGELRPNCVGVSTVTGQPYYSL